MSCWVVCQCLPPAELSLKLNVLNERKATFTTNIPLWTVASSVESTAVLFTHSHHTLLTSANYRLMATKDLAPALPVTAVCGILVQYHSSKETKT